ncbi:AAA family ATPase [Nonomuraea sp. NPDC046802]|uniref:AAA family ATPase n=1 Tax=Nonomuraea sp. NPDC046802 TaxID=3154919 RepID=UPI0033C7ED9D
MDTDEEPGKIRLDLQRGGKDKTTAAVNVAAALATPGKRALIVDVDPQGFPATGIDDQPFEAIIVDGPPGLPGGYGLRNPWPDGKSSGR